MRRKIVIIISVLMVIFDIGITVAVYDAGERQLAAAVEAAAEAVALVRDYVRPIPRLGAWGRAAEF